jgi:hypothetical protein
MVLWMDEKRANKNSPSVAHRLPSQCRSTCSCLLTRLTSSTRRPDTCHRPSMCSLSRPLLMGRPVVSMGAGWGWGLWEQQPRLLSHVEALAPPRELPNPAQKPSGDRCCFPSAIPSMAASTSLPEAGLTGWAFQNKWLWMFHKPGWMAPRCSAWTACPGSQVLAPLRHAWQVDRCFLFCFRGQGKALGEHRFLPVLPDFLSLGSEIGYVSHQVKDCVLKLRGSLGLC